MPRVNHWERKLADFVVERMNQPQEWGKVDCALTGCDEVKVITGKDPGKHFRGKYKTQRGAARMIKKFAGTMGEAVEKLADEFQLEEINPVFRQRGDICLVEGNWEDAIAFVGPGGTVWCSGKEGLEKVEEEIIKRAWKVN